MLSPFAIAAPLFVPRAGIGLVDGPTDEGGVPVPEKPDTTGKELITVTTDPWLAPRLRDVENRLGPTMAAQLKALLDATPKYQALVKEYQALVTDLARVRAGQEQATPAWIDQQRASIRRKAAHRQIVEDVFLTQLMQNRSVGLPASFGSREVTGPGGWKYEQFHTGAIIILTDPRPGSPAAGTLLPERARAAVEREIGLPAGVTAGSLMPSPDVLLAAQRARITSRQTGQTGQPVGPVTAPAQKAAPAQEAATQARPGLKARVAGARDKFQHLTPEQKRRALVTAGTVATVTGHPVTGAALASAAAISTLVGWARRRRPTEAALITKGNELDIRVDAETARLFGKALRWSPTERADYIRKGSAKVARLDPLSPAGKLASQKLEVVRMLDFQLNQEAARLANPATTEAPAVTTVVPLSGFAGLGDFAAATASTGGTISTEGWSGAPARLEPRLGIARAGEYVKGGVRLPREACAFVAGYLRRVYIPAAKAQITPDARAKLETLAGQFDQAASAATEEQATKLALSIGVRNLAVEWVNRLTNEVGQRLIKYAADNANIDGLRAWSRQILAHASALLAALGHPQAASRVYLAISGNVAQAAAVEAAVVDGAMKGAAAALPPIAAKAPEVGPTQTEASLRGAAQAADGAARALQDQTSAALAQAGVLAQQLGLSSTAQGLTDRDPQKAQKALVELETLAQEKGTREPPARPLADAALAAAQQARRSLGRTVNAGQVAQNVRTTASKLGVKLPPAPDVCSLLPKGGVAQFVCLHPILAAAGALAAVGALAYWQRDRIGGAAAEAGRRLRNTPGPVGVVASLLTPSGDGPARPAIAAAAAAAPGPEGTRPLGEAPEIVYLEALDDDDDDAADYGYGEVDDDEETTDDDSTAGEDIDDPDSD